MAYYRGKDIEKSRGNAVQEVILEKRSVAKVMNFIWSLIAVEAGVIPFTVIDGIEKMWVGIGVGSAIT